MKRVTDATYHGLRAKWPKASMIRPVQGGFEGYVFDDKDWEPRTVERAVIIESPEPRCPAIRRYMQHNFMDKG